MRMKKLGLSKLYFQLAESKDSMARSIEACQNAGLDTDYTMGQAIKLFIEKNNFDSVDDRYAPYHDAMHIVSLAYGKSAHDEAIAGITEHALLREPYNGNENEMIKKGHANPQYITHQFNALREETFEKPVSISNYKDAKSLGLERFEATLMLLQQNDGTKTPPTEEEFKSAYDRAVETDEFFRSLMAGRAIYQISVQELHDTPLCFFGITKEGDENTLEFKNIDNEIREKVLNNHLPPSEPLYKTDKSNTADEIRSLYPQSQNLHLLSSDL